MDKIVFLFDVANVRRKVCKKQLSGWAFIGHFDFLVLPAFCPLKKRGFI